MPKSLTFSNDLVAAFQKAKILGVRAGTEHRYTGVWVVVVKRRVFARSWNDKPTGWYRAFKQTHGGTVQLADLELPVNAKIVRSKTMCDAVTNAFAEKYNTKASLKWVEGFADPVRLVNTIEFTPG